MAKFSRIYKLLKLNINSYSHISVELFLLVVIIFTVGLNIFLKTSFSHAEVTNESLFFSYLKDHMPHRNEKLLQAYESVNIKLQTPTANKRVISASTIDRTAQPNNPKQAPLATLSGQALLKPNPASNTAMSDRKDIEVYEVKGGDTVGGIANNYGVSINTILWENNLSATSQIKPGQELNILPVTGVKHVVQKGETISSIAKKYGITDAEGLEEIFATNRIESEDLLAIGDELIIPNGTKKSAPSPERTQYLADLQKDNYQKVEVPSDYAGSGSGLNWPVPCAHRLSQYASKSHMAIDIPAKYCPVLAAADGIVEIAGWQNGYGNTIVVNHGNGVKTRYAHGSEIKVTAGESVAQGQIVMISGNTGRSTGPHLHFEVKVNGVLRNPLSYVTP